MKTYLFVAAATAITIMFQNCSAGFQTADRHRDATPSVASVGFSVPYRPNAGGFQPASVDGSETAIMERLKYKACMMNGLLSDNILSDFEPLLRRSSCVALPRAVETWNNPPQFAAIQSAIAQIAARSGGRHFDYGMFIAESIDITKAYKDDAGTAFNFLAMCKPGSRGQWGPNTCVPHLGSPEYRRYVKHIVRKAVQVGINNILFGQTGHQDPAMELSTFLTELRAIAKSEGKPVVFGQQPNGIQPTAYLKAFDYVTGPLYVDEDVSAACLPRIKSYCQAVLHHPSIAGNANNVIVELDWGSVLEDDTNKYAAKPLAQRKAYLNEKVSQLFAAGIGFNFPFRQMLAGDASGAHCYGPTPYIYSAHLEYGCKDETFLNEMLNGKFTVQTIATVPATPAGTGSTVGTPAPAPADNFAIVVQGFVKILERNYDSLKTDVQGIAYWVGRLNNGYPLSRFEADLRASDEYFVRGLYKSIFRRSADIPGLQYWVEVLGRGEKTRAQVQADFNYTCGLHQTECQ